ncbi:ABC transporter substrate-binding protein [Methanospirillum lacunae]|uniref:ABC transporter substrate-binding protein n=1 Tax=Methanospirillum lacunae TaxID=668570 RepID=A0A2V2N4Z9_9EURY|nr:ABC transporter substrate-binding protein [Methanospirillum lacunae]PWR71277.1 ABC transporter substrate-binding protein [Methanospirillum lacunae]
MKFNNSIHLLSSLTLAFLVLAVVVISSASASTVEVPKDVNKIGCLFGPSYEKVVILGAEDKITMASDSHQTLWPWSNIVYKDLNKIPVIIKNAQTPNIEDLVKNKPDVIFFWNTPETVQKIEDAGIPVVPAPDTKKFEDVKTSLDSYAQVLGPDAKAISKDYADYFDKKLAYVKSNIGDIPSDQRPSVYFAIRKPLQTAGANSDISEMISLAGGKSVTDGLDAGFGTDITVEQLLKWNPDYIIIDHCGASNLGSKPADQTLQEMVNDTRFSDLSAMKNQHVYISPTGVFFWDAGQQQILQLMWLAKLLHPDKFQDLNMNNEVKEFYSKFYHYELTDDQADRILKLLPPVKSGGT